MLKGNVLQELEEDIAKSRQRRKKHKDAGVVSRAD